MVLPFVFSLILLPFSPGGKEAVSKWLWGTEVAIWGLTMTDVDHNPLEPGWASFQSTTLTTYLVCISSFCLWAHYRNRVESLTKINTTNICGSHPLHQVTHCVANNYQIHQALFLLHKFMVITSSDLSALNVLETASRIICSYHLHKDGGEADWPVAPSIFLLVILKGRSEICIIPGLRNLPHHHDPNRVIESGLTVTEMSSLSTHWHTPAGPRDL